MKKKFVTSLALLIFLNLLIKPFYVFVIEPSVQNAVGNVAYGFYFSLLGFSFLFNIILDAGITNFNNRDIAQYRQLFEKYLSNIISLKMILGVVYFIITFAVAFIIDYSPVQIKMLLLLALNQFISCFTLYLRSNLTALHYFKTDSILSVLDRLLLIVICSVLLWAPFIEGPFQIEWFVYAQTFAYAFTFLFALVLVVKKAQYFKLFFDFSYYRALLKKSIPFALLILLMTSYKWFDSFIIERLLPHPIGKEQAGIYAQSFRILDGVSQYAYLFSIFLLPLFSRMIIRKEKVGQITRLSSMLLVIPVLTLAIATFFYRHDIITLLYHQDEENSSVVLGILMISFIGISISYIFGTLLTANGSLRVLNKLAAAAVVMNVALNFLLIPQYKAVGCAMASAVAQLFMAFAQVFFSVKIFRFSVKKSLIIKTLAYAGFMILISWLSFNIITFWAIRFIGVMVIGIFIAVVIQLIDIRVIGEIFTESDKK